MTRFQHSISASLVFTGFIDYWQGAGPRDRTAHLFATYGPTTTAAELVEQWCGDFEAGGACDDWPEQIETAHVREALILLVGGAEQHASGDPCELAEALDPDEYDDGTDDYPSAIVRVTYGD